MVDDLTFMERREIMQTARLADTLESRDGGGDTELSGMLARHMGTLCAGIGGGHAPGDGARPHICRRCGKGFDSWTGFALHLLPDRYEAGFHEDADGDYWLKTVDGEWLYADMLWGDKFGMASLGNTGGVDPESLDLDRITPADLVCIDSDDE